MDRFSPYLFPFAFFLLATACTAEGEETLEFPADEGQLHDDTWASSPKDASSGADSTSGQAVNEDPCIVGDTTKAVEFVLLDHDDNEVKDGASFELNTAPQGGMLASFGIRARNINACLANVQLALIDPCDSRVLAVEGRPITLTPTGEGWAQSMGESNHGHFPACPNASTTRDINDQAYLLEVKVYDDEGRQSQNTIELTPLCPEGDQACECQCDSSYSLGVGCEPDSPNEISGECPQ